MTALTKFESSGFDESQIQLLKNTICKGSSDDELRFFIYTCQKTGLDPFSRQIYSVPRGGQRVIQTSVDGYRLIAERTGRYSPGREPTFMYDKHGQLFSATSYVQKQTKDGTWHEVAASAMMSEYDGKNNFWKKMPHLMLAKCAECLALRKAFPAEMSGLYGEEEMHQADAQINPPTAPKLMITDSQVNELDVLMEQLPKENAEKVNAFIRENYNCVTFSDLNEDQYKTIKKKMTLTLESFKPASIEIVSE